VSDPGDIKKRFEALAPFLDERRRRLVAASDVLAGASVEAVSEATGLASATILRGVAELEKGDDLAVDRVRKPGGGRILETEKQPGLVEALKEIIQPAIMGDPQAPLLWVSKSQRNIAEALTKLGFQVSHKLIGRLLKSLEFSLQVNRKTQEGRSHPDRDAQFEYINERIKEFQSEGQPAISVDTKKKELVGNFKNTGQELCPKGKPVQVSSHDFPTELGKVTPYGVYDITKNLGFVSVGISNDTASFAVASIRKWWETLGKKHYPDAKRLLITADCGGSNAPKTRLWKLELQRLADVMDLSITVAHHPPGTSKWNRIEHRLFAFITKNWRGRPLLTHQVVVQLIAATTTASGLSVQCCLDESSYSAGIKIKKNTLKILNIIAAKFHGEWNYTVHPFVKDRDRV